MKKLYKRKITQTKLSQGREKRGREEGGWKRKREIRRKVNNFERRKEQRGEAAIANE